jgi:proteasome lid subunit RPN8/RPN11
MQSIIEHANGSELEVCGFVFVENGDLKTEAAKNIAVYENDIFEIHPLEILRQIRSGKLAAIYHTHPTSTEQESTFDRFNCENSCIPYVIYSKETKNFNLLIPKKPHVKQDYIDILKKKYD